MANKKNTSDPKVRGDKKAARAALNEQQRLANIERRKAGKPTPWEEKRAARRASRLAKQVAYRDAQDRKHEANRARDEREQKARDAQAKELQRELTKGARKRVANASR